MTLSWFTFNEDKLNPNYVVAAKNYVAHNFPGSTPPILMENVDELTEQLDKLINGRIMVLYFSAKCNRALMTPISGLGIVLRRLKNDNAKF